MSKVDNITLIRESIKDYIMFDVKKYFEDFAEDVANTKELNNVIISFRDYPKPNKPFVTNTDKEEQNWLIKEIDFAINKLKKDKYTRQAIIYNLHESGLDHNCLNIFHLYFRNNELDMNVYVRSMNIDANFDNDMYTFNLILEKASKESSLPKGKINVQIMSLHTFKK